MDNKQIERDEICRNLISALEAFTGTGFQDLETANSSGWQHAKAILGDGNGNIELRVELQPQVVVRVFLVPVVEGEFPATQLFMVRVERGEFRMPGGMSLN